MHRWHSWGVSLPSLPSLSNKSGLFCACSFGFLLSFELDALLAGLGLSGLFLNFLLVQGLLSQASSAIRSQYL